MRLAGIAYQPPRSWTKELVLREIRKLHRAGKSLAATQVDNALILSARRRFGSWPTARAQAVPGFADPYKSWTKRKLVDELAALQARGISLSATKLRRTGRGRLVNAAVRLFGSWDGARARVAGFTPTQQSWTKDTVLRAMRARHRRSLSMSATVVKRDDGPLMAAVLRYFESWPIARDAARVPYRDPRRTWPPERVIAALRRHAPDGKRPTIARVGQALYKVAIARFGSFPAACRAAGLGTNK